MDKQIYMINYNDNSHMALELTDVDYAIVHAGIELGQRVVHIDGVGVLVLSDIRSIILQLPTEEAEQPSYAPERTAEEEEWLRQEEWVRKHYASLENEAKDDADYDGGMIPK